MKKAGRIYVVGIGPGEDCGMTLQAVKALERCDVIVGYQAYVEMIRPRYPDKEYYANGMRGEIERCAECIRIAGTGKTAALICSGDAGIYGMASPMLEVAAREGFHDVEIIAGVTAANSGAALLGAPLGNDLCIISLSDLLTPWEQIEKRLRCAAGGDFCIVIYNPASVKRAGHLKRACTILMDVLSPETACGYARNIGRAGTETKTCSLKELADLSLDMFTTVFVGNSMTRIEDGRLITPRGYRL